jgi:hypothetical protein
MFLSLLPNADDIEKWAKGTKAAEYLLAELIGPLIEHTAKPTHIHVPTGRATNEKGPDGTVEAPERTPWVPEGRSIWDWGVGPPDAKAEKDYRARTKGTDGAELKQSTFVFVTPWKWAKRDSWAKKKAALGDWKDVKALNASDLALWLGRDFASLLRLYEWIHGPVPDVRTLASVWTEWAQAFWPPKEATPELMLAGRLAAADQVRAWVGTPGYHVFRAETRDEGAAFVAAALVSSPAHSSAVHQAAAVESVDAWRRVVAIEREPMILVPLFAEPNIKAATDRGDTVIIVAEIDRQGEFAFTLSGATPDELVVALRNMDVEAGRAGRIAKEAHGSMLRLRRHLRELKAGETWSPGQSRLLSAIGFVGGWDETRAADLAVVVTLAGSDYETLQTSLTDIARVPGSPLIRDTDVSWASASQLDTLRRTARGLPRTVWDAFGAAAVEVLGARDPAWDLPPEERWMANVKDKARSHSARLRRGIAEAIAILGTQPDFEGDPAAQSGPGFAAGVVARLLRAANEDATGTRWADLADALPLLAEASPNVFVDEVQHGLEGPSPVLRRLLPDEPGMLTPRSRITELLWALERLAWSPDYLSAVAVILARLAEMDPGEQSDDRPLRSLGEILLPWHPETTADATGRLDAIRAIRRVAPKASWKLMDRLLPKGAGDVGGVSSKPEWRSWAPVEESNKVPADYWTVVGAILDFMLEDAGRDASRWKDLIEAYDDIPPPLGDKVVASLRDIDPATLPSSDLQLLSDALRTAVSRHRTYPDALWALPPSRVDELEALGQRFVPPDPVREHVWLFAAHPSLERVSGADYRRYDARLKDLRADALAAILERRGWSGVEDLVRSAEQAWTVGFALASVTDDRVARILEWSFGEDAAQVLAVRGYVAARTLRDGWPWAEDFIRTVVPRLAPSRSADLLLAASRDKVGWTFAAMLGPEVERAYWLVFDGLPDGEDQWIAVRHLIDVGRPFWATQVIGGNLSLKRGPFVPELAFEALAATTTVQEPPPPGDVMGLDHDVAQVIRALDAAGFDPIALASVEWPYVRILEHHNPEALKHLYQRLATEPDFFVEVVSLVFRGENEQPSEPDPVLARYAEQGLSLLWSWKGPIPGHTGDGDVDQAELDHWVDRARELLQATGRAAIGDQRIGHALWYSPAGIDGLRPHDSVRNLLERVASQDVETGFEIEAINGRGVVMRGRGGDQERELARNYRDIATRLRGQWPRTAQLYQAIADQFEATGRIWDRESIDD